MIILPPAHFEEYGEFAQMWRKFTRVQLRFGSAKSPAPPEDAEYALLSPAAIGGTKQFPDARAA